MTSMHANIKQLPDKAPQKQVDVATNISTAVLVGLEPRELEPITEKLEETRPTKEVYESCAEVTNKELMKENAKEIEDIEEFLDIEKETLHTEAENWRKTE